MLEVGPEVDADGAAPVQRDGGVVAALVEVAEGLALALAVLEEQDAAAGQRPQAAQRLLHLVLVLVVQVALELHQRLRGERPTDGDISPFIEALGEISRLLHYR